MTRKKLAESNEEKLAILAAGERRRGKRLHRDFDQLMEEYHQPVGCRE